MIEIAPILRQSFSFRNAHKGKKIVHELADLTENQEPTLFARAVGIPARPMNVAPTKLRNGLAPRQKRAADPRDLSVKNRGYLGHSRARPNSPLFDLLSFGRFPGLHALNVWSVNTHDNIQLFVLPA